MARVEFVVDGGQRQLDRPALLLGRDPVGRDELGGQHLPLPVRRDVVHLAEQDRVAVIGLHGHPDGRGAGDAACRGERGGVEAGVLAREVEGEADAEGGELGEGAADSGDGGDGRRTGSCGVADLLRVAAQLDGLPAAAQSGVGVGGRAAGEGGAVGGVDAAGPGDAEGGAGVGALFPLQVAVEPGTDPLLYPAGLPVAPVVPMRPSSRRRRGRRWR